MTISESLWQASLKPETIRMLMLVKQRLRLAHINYTSLFSIMAQDYATHGRKWDPKWPPTSGS